MGKRGYRPPPGETSYSIAEEASLVLRRYPLPALLGCHNPLVTAVFIIVASCIGITFTRLGVFRTLLWGFITATLFVGAFAHLRGNFRGPKAARFVVQRWSDALLRNVIRPIAAGLLQHPWWAFALISLLAEVSNWIADDSITITLAICTTAAVFTIREHAEAVHRAAHAAVARLPEGAQLKIKPLLAATFGRRS